MIERFSERGTEARLGEAGCFVEEVLLPFLARSQIYHKPSAVEIGALLWGYGRGRDRELSVFDVASAVRRVIARTELGQGVPGYSSRGLINALHIVDQAIPEVAARYWLNAPTRST